MVLTTELLPLSKAVVAIGSSLLLTSAAYEYFHMTHPAVPSMSPEWVAATHEMADGHVHRQASAVDVELNPARRLREHTSSSKGKLIDMGGWF